jgi:hypothetical protein
VIEPSDLTSSAPMAGVVLPDDTKKRGSLFGLGKTLSGPGAATLQTPLRGQM